MIRGLTKNGYTRTGLHLSSHRILLARNSHLLRRLLLLLTLASCDRLLMLLLLLWQSSSCSADGCRCGCYSGLNVEHVVINILPDVFVETVDCFPIFTEIFHVLEEVFFAEGRPNAAGSADGPVVLLLLLL